MMLKKSLSQNLIKDRNILNKIVDLSGVKDEDIVVEIGAGHGDLTRVLVGKARHVYAVEIDRSFGHYLDQLAEEYKNLTVISGDILDLTFEQIGLGRKIKVVANIPYKITGHILFKLIGERAFVTSAYLTVQREIAERIVSKPFRRTYGALSVICQLVADTKILLYLKPGLFVPSPKVGSAYIALIFKKEGNDIDGGMTAFIKACFAHKRKSLRQALIRRYGNEKTAAIYESMHFVPSVRAEEVGSEDFRKMYNFFKLWDTK